MARSFLTAIDLNKNELQNPRVHNLAAAPGSPVEGQLYYDTVTKKLYWRSDSAWVDATGGTSGIQGTLFDAKGDIIVATAADTPARKAVGANNTFLVANSAQSDGLEWRALATGDIGAALLQEKIATADLTDWPRVAALDLNSQKITSLADPTTAQDAATKAYVDAFVNGMDWKQSVRAATTANIASLAGGAPNTLDGVSLAANDRILVKNQSTGSQNGIYVVTTLGTGSNGTWTRATDADASAEVTSGFTVAVAEGTTQADTIWTLTTNDPITVGTTALTFTQIPGASDILAGAGMTRTGQTLDVVAGTGISVAADAVSVDTSVVVRKFAANVGNGSLTTIDVTHSLGTRDVTVMVYRATTPWDSVECDVQMLDTNNVRLIFAAAPTSNQYRVVVHG